MSPARHRQVWTREDYAILDANMHLSDRAIGDLLGRTRKAVEQQRAALDARKAERCAPSTDYRKPPRHGGGRPKGAEGVTTAAIRETVAEMREAGISFEAIGRAIGRCKQTAMYHAKAIDRSKGARG